MSGEREDTLARAERFVRARGNELSVERILPLVGDASTRSYFRLQRRGDRTSILALLPEPFEEKDSAFLSSAELFRAIPIRIPEIELVSGPEGALVLEDLGDRLLQHEFAEMDTGEKQRLYGEAVDILIRLQQRGRELEDPRYCAFRTRFDTAKFRWELDFFLKHFVGGLRGVALSPEETRDLSESFHELATELASVSDALCHRDYHSRNLMVTGNELAVIDFQDARIGPSSYDLVSLLHDSYVEHSDELVGRMRERFERGIGRGLSGEYELAALQRNLKALGTFGYQIAVRGNEVYRDYVEHTLKMVRGHLAESERWRGMRSILAAHLVELQ